MDSPIHLEWIGIRAANPKGIVQGWTMSTLWASPYGDATPFLMALFAQ